MASLVTPNKKLKSINRDCIPGYRGGHVITNEDRLIEIASTSLMIHNDIKTLEKACQELINESKDPSSFKIKSLPSKVRKLKLALDSISLYANNILVLTRKNSITKYNASRDATSKKMEEKKERQLQKQREDLGLRKENPLQCLTMLIP